MSTKDNLQAAFAGESQANRTYTAFAQKAEAEGHTAVAKLFRAAADAETVHALNHLRVMGKVGGTGDNLKEAIEGENYEHTSMYPGFIAEAEAEGNNAAVMTFKSANAVEKIHAALYEKALANLDNPVDVNYHVCQVCGNTVENDAPDVCPICGAMKSQFKLID